MRWNKVGVVVLLLFSLLLAGCPPEPSPSDTDVWGTILKVGSLGFLCNFTNSPGCEPNENDLVALMRVLIGILTFALFYMAASAVPGLKEQRNIAITVSIILAIMSVIFIPPSILIGIGAAYSTLVAIVIIGAPILGGFILYRSMSDSHWVFKVIVLVLILLLLTAVKYFARNIAGGIV